MNVAVLLVCAAAQSAVCWLMLWPVTPERHHGVCALISLGQILIVHEGTLMVGLCCFALVSLMMTVLVCCFLASYVQLGCVRSLNDLLFLTLVLTAYYVWFFCVVQAIRQ